MKELDGVYNALQAQRKNEMNELTDRLAKLRSAQKMNTAPEQLAELNAAVNEAYEKTQTLAKQIQDNRFDYGMTKGQLENHNRKKIFGAALPVSAGFGLGTGVLGTEG